jgi:hypothetical protein
MIRINQCNLQGTMIRINFNVIVKKQKGITIRINFDVIFKEQINFNVISLRNKKE